MRSCERERATGRAPSDTDVDRGIAAVIRRAQNFFEIAKDCKGRPPNCVAPAGLSPKDQRLTRYCCSLAALHVVAIAGLSPKKARRCTVLSAWHVIYAGPRLAWISSSHDMAQELLMKTRFLSMVKATSPTARGRISLSRDIARDWQRWSRAERATAISILAVLLVEMSLGLAAGVRSFT